MKTNINVCAIAITQNRKKAKIKKLFGYLSGKITTEKMMKINPDDIQYQVKIKQGLFETIFELPTLRLVDNFIETIKVSTQGLVKINIK